jgi:hypothetical protein
LQGLETGEAIKDLELGIQRPLEGAPAVQTTGQDEDDDDQSNSESSGEGESRDCSGA